MKYFLTVSANYRRWLPSGILPLLKRDRAEIGLTVPHKTNEEKETQLNEGIHIEYMLKFDKIQRLSVIDYMQECSLDIILLITRLNIYIPQKMNDMRISILLLLLTLMANTSICQEIDNWVDGNPIFDEHIIKIVSHKKLFKHLIKIEDSGDSSIYIDVTKYSEFSRQKPIQIKNVNVYLWKQETFFFYNQEEYIALYLIDVKDFAYSVYYTFITYTKKKLYVEVEISQRDIYKDKIPPEIKNLIMYKMKKVYSQ